MSDMSELSEPRSAYFAGVSRNKRVVLGANSKLNSRALTAMVAPENRSFTVAGGAEAQGALAAGLAGDRQIAGVGVEHVVGVVIDMDPGHLVKRRGKIQERRAGQKV